MNDGTADHRRVLIVAPAGPTARAMEDALAHEGIAVTAAPDVFWAVARAAVAPPEAVVLSLATFDDRDIEVIRFFRTHRPRAFILVSFPAERRELAVRALATGADAYLLEPFYLGEFLDLVRRGIERGAAPPAGAAPPGAPEVARELERLAGAVAHAINNPLQIMELLLSEGPVSDASEFRQEITRVHAVAGELLAFSRRTDYHEAPGCDVNRAVRAGVEDRLPAPAVVDLRLGRLPAFRGDEDRLRQAFSTFAAIASARGPRLPLVVETSFEVAPPEPGIVVKFSVRDLLLSRTETERFADLFQGPVAGEVGLAGATARMAVEMHGGTITVQSSPGEGSTLTVRLPLPAPDEIGGTASPA